MVILGKREEGFTLVEVLVTLGLFGIVLGGLMSVFWFGFYGFQKETDRAEIQYSARQARSRILDDFRACNSFTIMNKDGTPGDCLHLEMDGDETIDYYVQSQQLYRDSSKSSPQPAASHIESVNFESPTAGLLEFTVKDTAGHESTTSCKGRVDYKKGE